MTKKELVDSLAAFSDEAEVTVTPQYVVSAREPAAPVNSDTAPTEVVDAEPAVADEVSD